MLYFLFTKFVLLGHPKSPPHNVIFLVYKICTIRPFQKRDPPAIQLPIPKRDPPAIQLPIPKRDPPAIQLPIPKRDPPAIQLPIPKRDPPAIQLPIPKRDPPAIQLLIYPFQYTYCFTLLLHAKSDSATSGRLRHTFL
jgi:hypothetical protein